MSFPSVYREIREAIREMVLETKFARDIMRKAGWSTAQVVSRQATILSLAGSKRVCFDRFVSGGRPFPSHDGNFAVSDDGHMWAWGFNDSNRFGLGDFFLGISWLTSPTIIAAAIDDAVLISSNSFSTEVLRADGSVWTTNPDAAESVDAHRFFIREGFADVIQIDSNEFIACGAHYWLKSDGTIWGAGCLMAGMGSFESPFAPPYHWTDDIETPSLMPTAKTGSDVVEISALDESLAWRRAAGDIKIWRNQQEFPLTPTDRPAGVVKISAGALHVALLTSGGEIWVTGNNDRGTYGNGTSDISATPFAAWHKADGEDYTDVACAAGNTFGIKGGQIYAWGAFGPGLGLGEAFDSTDVLTPTVIEDPAIDDFEKIYGYNTTFNPIAVRENGCAYIWGSNQLGYLGQGHIYGPGVTVTTNTGAAWRPIPLLISEGFPQWQVV